jgi:C1A family cysteine protease
LRYHFGKSISPKKSKVNEGENPMKRNRLPFYALGWLPDIPDIRDIPFRTVFKLPAKLPPKADCREFCSVIEDQGELGSCTAQALVGALEFLQLRAISKGLDCGFSDLSRLFVYYNTREAMGTVREDSGASLRTGIKELKRRGACRESAWPYIPAK